MKAVKTFDCVEMKNSIQARQRREWAGLSDGEVRRRIQKRLAASDDPLARKWRRLAKADGPADWQQKLRQLKGKVQWVGDLEEMRRDK